MAAGPFHAILVGPRRSPAGRAGQGNESGQAFVSWLSSQFLRGPKTANRILRPSHEEVVWAGKTTRKETFLRFHPKRGPTGGNRCIIVMSAREGGSSNPPMAEERGNQNSG